MPTTLPLSSKTHVAIVENGYKRIIPVQELRSRFAVDALVRIHVTDFALLHQHGKILVHFNLEITTNKVGGRYAIVPIIRAGRRLADGRELLPVIDPTRCRLGTCTEVMQRLAIDQVTSELLGYSLSNIRTLQQLREALTRRYSGMFPDLSVDQILARGCAVTRIVLDAQ